MAASPYAGQLSYLDFVIPATRAVFSPEITPEGIVRSSTGRGGSEASGAGDSPGLTVGQATSMNQSGPIGSSRVFGSNTSNMALAGQVAVQLGLNPIAGLLFTAADQGAKFLAGYNIDPVTGLQIGSKEFQAIRADPMVNTVINPSLAAISPLANATFLGQNLAPQPFSTGATPGGLLGFSTFGRVGALGGSFSSSFVGGAPIARGAEASEGTPAGNPSAPPGFGVDDTGGMTTTAKRGGLVRGSLRDRLDDKRYLLQSGEYVIRRASVAKYRTLLDAINRDRPAEVRRLASKLQARFAA
jgi:hypothetical protein